MLPEIDSSKERVLEPALATIEDGRRDYLGGISVAQVYRDLGLGRYKAVKAGKRTLLVVPSVKRYVQVWRCK
jgi:hypothetical protein